MTVRRPPDRAFTSEAAVRDLATVRRFAALIDGLKPMPPGALDCTGKLDDPVDGVRVGHAAQRLLGITVPRR